MKEQIEQYRTAERLFYEDNPDYPMVVVFRPREQGATITWPLLRGPASNHQQGSMAEDQKTC